MTLAIGRICLVPRLHRLGYVTEKCIDEEGLGRRRTGTRQAQSFKLSIIIPLNVQVVNSVLHASFFLSI